MTDSTLNHSDGTNPSGAQPDTNMDCPNQPNLTPTPNPQDKPTQAQTKVLQIGKANFYASCWYAGASYREIARVAGVSHQAVHTLARRVLGVDPQRDGLLASTEQVGGFYKEWVRDPNRSVEALVIVFKSIRDGWVY